MNPSPALEIRYAGFFRRLLATFIDWVIYLVLISIIMGPHFSLISKQGIVPAIISVCIVVILWTRFWGTPGKILLSCQVMDADTLEPVSWRQSLIRIVAYGVSLVPVALGFLTILSDNRKQGFHDKIANTLVVYSADISKLDESQKTLEQLVSEVR